MSKHTKRKEFINTEFLNTDRIRRECGRSILGAVKSPVLAVIPLQFAGLLFVWAKGAGSIYLDMLPLLILLTILSTFFVVYVRGNQKILLLALLLLTVGTMLQSIFKEEKLIKNPELYQGKSLTSELQVQYLLAFLAAVFVGMIYWNMKACASMHMAEFLTIISVLLSLVTLLMSKGVGNVKNWISIGGFSLQSTELTKFFYLFIAAALLGTVERPDWRRVIAFYVVSFLDMGFLVLQSEFGTLLLMIMVFFTFLFLFVPDLRVFFFTLISMATALFLSASLGLKLSKMAEAGSKITNNPLIRLYLSNFQKIANRVIYWIHPENDSLGQGYQLLKARESIALGGWFGTSSITDLPVKTSDLVFPALIQRCGMIFAMLVFMIFILLWLEGMKICVRKKDKYHQMTAVGLTSMFLDQSIIIIAGSTGLCPLTGITLPFISSGGSSLLVSFMLMSVLLCVSGNISWKGQSSEEVQFFKKGTDCAEYIIDTCHRHVCGLVQNLRTRSGNLSRGGSDKRRSKADRV